MRYIAAHDQTLTRWNKLREEGPGPYRYWYRQSPRYFETTDQIEVDRPALDVSGMTSVYLDTEGRLHWFSDQRRAGMYSNSEMYRPHQWAASLVDMDDPPRSR